MSPYSNVGAMQPPLILALDTSTGTCTVALARGETILAYERMDEFRQQSRLLLGMIDRVCSQAGIAPMQLSAIACTLGPGSFTSLRVGLAAAKGLALATHTKLIGLSTLHVLAHGAALHNPQSRDILALIDAHRGEVYAQCFSPDLTAQDEPGALAAEALAKWNNRKLLVAGNVRTLAEKWLGKHAAYDDSATHPDARWGALMASKIYAAGTETHSNPIYIRPPDAKLPVKPNAL